jgi:hypothetical protein
MSDSFASSCGMYIWLFKDRGLFLESISNLDTGDFGSCKDIALTLSCTLAFIY